ncbi:FAD:protein FMN transferase [Lonepinella koalarum]|uniref:FAD:protein FMN transferase n=1 Tax=Lonepinella koalarum TaxID=53417 RepID=A0A4R1KQA9_9PAST|nr:FAD:protein FMN transferase [Lonepinella koalarum]MDH2925624.1 thiamine biosynthesis protein ApbE [Lonepinella koalarum]TCK67182.1 thiamine biosynthesis lipoprotein [Lonepinella koalarum]TFJ89160.1 FAD:protein FMN transferase [Lonepinella koalarum]TYG35014.1 FAD:protein FMN transferase [Lonepinella koalarum]
MKYSIKYLFTLVLSLLLVACSKDPEIITLTGKTMGTTYHIKYIDDGKVSQKVEQAHEQIEVILKQVNDQMSTYIPTSELSRFNQNTQINQPIEISPELGKVITESLRLNKLTDGALDVTVGPLVNLWGFGPDKRLDKEPSQQELNECLALVGINKLKLTQSAEKFSLEKSIPELYIDLSSIAKGYGVDQVAGYLETIGTQNYLVEIGGEIRAKGKNAEQKTWQIAIEQPNLDGSRTIQQVIGLDNIGMATSGDYRNYFEQDGVRYSHEIDPKTGYPVQHHLASITVLHPSAMTADGLSTGLFVLGEEKALEIAEQQGIAIFMIIKTDNGFETKTSSKFTSLLAEQN